MSGMKPHTDCDPSYDSLQEGNERGRTQSSRVIRNPGAPQRGEDEALVPFNARLRAFVEAQNQIVAHAPFDM